MLCNSEFSSCDGSKIRYTKVGINKKGKIFFVGGLFANRIMWVPFAIPFLMSHECVLVDIRGHGFSEDNSKIEDDILDLHAKDLAELFERECDSNNNIVVSLSLGATNLLKSSEYFNFNKINKAIFIEPPIVTQKDKDNHLKNLGTVYSKIIESNVEKIQKQNMLQIFQEANAFSELPLSCKEIAEQSLELIFIVGSKGLRTRFPLLNKIPSKARILIMKTASFTEYKFNTYFKLASAFLSKEEDYSEYLKNMQNTETHFFLGMNNQFFNNERNIERILSSKRDSVIVKFKKSGHDLQLNEPIKFLKEFWNSIND
jgi:pimeloyl-ACP methyl ester carboxylesterase